MRFLIVGIETDKDAQRLPFVLVLLVEIVIPRFDPALFAIRNTFPQLVGLLQFRCCSLILANYRQVILAQLEMGHREIRIQTQGPL